MFADIEAPSWFAVGAFGGAVPGNGALRTAHVRQELCVRRSPRRQLRHPRVLAGGGRQHAERAHRDENGHRRLIDVIELSTFLSILFIIFLNMILRKMAVIKIHVYVIH